jgi:hypothetical protein
MDLRSIRANLASPQGTEPPQPATAAVLARQASAVTPRSGPLSFLAKPATWVRRHQRHPCCIIGVLDILDRGIPLDGLVTEISEGGALFRNASAFLLDRRGAPIALRVALTAPTVTHYGAIIDPMRVGELLRGVTVTGNAFEVLSSVDGVSDTLRWDLGSGHCGKGQPAKVDAGGPHLRCKALLSGRSLSRRRGANRCTNRPSRPDLEPIVP